MKLASFVLWVGAVGECETWWVGPVHMGRGLFTVFWVFGWFQMMFSECFFS
jgi:hypothetical protein